MNIPYLLKCLETNKLSDLVAVIELVPLDMNLALWDSEAAGEIKIDQDDDRVTVLIPDEDIQPWHNPDLTNKLLRTIQHYANTGQTNATRGRLNSVVKDPLTNVGYLTHEYIMSMQYLVDEGVVVEDVVKVPKTGKRPYQEFVFIGLPENADKNEEWNARVVNKWIDDFAKQTKKK